jgi:hypothetical protein
MAKESIMNLYPVLSKLYPENSFQGQCFTFMHELVDFPHIGTLLGSKKAALNSVGIPISKLDSIKVGDVLLLNYPIYGHGALVNNIQGSELQLTESNFKLDGRVHHTRKIPFHDPNILGVFRGKDLYPLPVINYPVQLRCTILMNNQPFWNSLLKHMANLQDWFWQASGQKLQLIIDYKNTNLSGWNTVFTGPVIGGANMEIIDPVWMKNNVAPQAVGSHLILFVMPRSAWNGTVFDHPEQIELGFNYEHNIHTQDALFPNMAMLVADEHDDYSPYYPPPLSAFAKLAAHEICHGLYGLCAGSRVVPGGDYTHNHWFGTYAPMDCFKDFDLEKLNSLINP